MFEQYTFRTYAKVLELETIPLANISRSNAKRIVSLVPSLTELLADLDLDKEVVGLTRFCVHPSGWKARKQIVGGTKNVRADRVLALDPDLIIANKEENTKADVEALQAHVPVLVTDIRTVDDSLAAIRTIGIRVGRRRGADALATTIAAAFADLKQVQPLRAVYLIWREPYMTIGSDTFIHDVMQRGGFYNVFGEAKRYPEVSPEDLVAAAPDVVLLSSEPYPFKEKHIVELRAWLPDTPIHLVNGELFSWYGSRMQHTPAYLKTLRCEKR